MVRETTERRAAANEPAGTAPRGGEPSPPAPEAAAIPLLFRSTRAARAQLFQTIYRQVAFKLGRSNPDVPDLAQEIFLHIFRKIPSLVARIEGAPPFEEPRSADAWVRCVTTRKVIDHVRRRMREQALIAPVDVGDAEAEGDGEGWLIPEHEGAVAVVRGKELTQQIERAMEDLTEAERVVFVLSAMEGMCDREIAEELGISCGAVRKRLQRARTIMRTALVTVES